MDRSGDVCPAGVARTFESETSSLFSLDPVYLWVFGGTVLVCRHPEVVEASVE